MTHKIIKSNDVVSIFVTFVDSNKGKTRPALVVKTDETTLTILRITSKYENKSNTIKKQYYPIKEWQQAGLYKPSYIDVGSTIKINKDLQKKLYKIGTLTITDIKGLNQFANNYQQNQN